jgi:hypothetical protein
MEEAIGGLVPDLVLPLDEAGVLEWEDRKTNGLSSQRPSLARQFITESMEI